MSNGTLEALLTAMKSTDTKNIVSTVRSTIGDSTLSAEDAIRAIKAILDMFNKNAIVARQAVNAIDEITKHVDEKSMSQMEEMIQSGTEQTTIENMTSMAAKQPADISYMTESSTQTNAAGVTQHSANLPAHSEYGTSREGTYYDDDDYHWKVLHAIAELPDVLKSLSTYLPKQDEMMVKISNSVVNLNHVEVPALKKAIHELRDVFGTQPADTSLDKIKQHLQSEKKYIEGVQAIPNDQNGAGKEKEQKKELFQREIKFWPTILHLAQAAQGNQDTNRESRKKLNLLLDCINDNLSFFNTTNENVIKLMSLQDIQGEALTRIDMAMVQIR